MKLPACTIFLVYSLHDKCMYIVHVMKLILFFEDNACVTHSRWISFRYKVTSTFFLTRAMGFRWPCKVKGKLTHQESESHAWTDEHHDKTYIEALLSKSNAFRISERRQSRRNCLLRQWFWKLAQVTSVRLCRWFWGGSSKINFCYILLVRSLARKNASS